MNGDDQFEKRLQRQTPRRMPPAWRAEILSAARAAVDEEHTALVARRGGFLATVKLQLSLLLWPHPKAWACLAAVWLLIFGLNLADREPAQEAAGRALPPSPQIRELLQQQEQMFAELVGPREKPEADRPKPVGQQPRSERRSEFLNA